MPAPITAAHAGAVTCLGEAAPAPRLTLARVLGAALRRGVRPALCADDWKILNALLACRTPALGAHQYRCADCGGEHLVPHSCRNRHCPTCQGALAQDWLERQRESLLPVAYFHAVFTLPHVLNPLIAQNRRVLLDLLFHCASATLLEFGCNRWQARLGITAVLHTWSQTLLDHHHLHCIVTGGGLCRNGSRWRGTRCGYLFPVRALSKVFRAKYRDGLRALFDRGLLECHGELATLSRPTEFAALLRQACRPPWVVYAKRPFAGPEQVLAYLSRYTHRVAIGNRRLLSLDTRDGTVTFGYKDYADGSRCKAMTLSLGEFLRRFCLHLLPRGFVKIRHYGLLANRGRQQHIERARQLLACQPQRVRQAVVLKPEAQEVAAAKPHCPFCGSVRLRLLRIHPSLAGAPQPPPLVFDSS